MGVTVGVNFRSVVHKKSSGVTFCFPDVCKTPTPGGPVPIPYPNIARSANTAKGTKKVKCDGKPICVKTSKFSTSVGDEPGVLKGIISSKIKGQADFVTYSFDTKAEGKNVCRAFDLMFHNKKNTPPFPLIQQPIVVIIMPERPVCLICNKSL